MAMDLQATIRLVDEFSKPMQDAEKATEDFKKTASSLDDLQNTLSNIGGSLTKNVTAPLVGLGSAAFYAADDMQSAMRDIQVQTGATGDELDTLEEDFREVFTSIPTGSEEASSALAALHGATETTGDELQDITTHVLEASRMMGEDGAQNAESFAEAMNQWQVESADAPDTLDSIYAATQGTTVGFGELIGHLTEYGSVLNNAGYDMEEAAGFMTELERQGISISRVMPGLNMAFRNWADEGKDLTSELENTFDAMQQAESDSEALAIAMDTFGVEGSQRLTTAVRNGEIAVDDLTEAMDGAEGSIMDAADGNYTFAEAMSLLGNKTMAAAEPLGNVLVDLLDDAMPYIEDAVDWVVELADSFRDLDGDTKELIGQIGLFAAALGPAILAVNGLISVIRTARTVFLAFNAVLLKNPIGLVVTAIAGLIYAGYQLITNWEEITESITNFFSELAEGEGMIAAFAQAFERNFETIFTVVEETWGFITRSFSRGIEFIAALLEGDLDEAFNIAGEQFRDFEETTDIIWQEIQDHFDEYLNEILPTFEEAWESLKIVAGELWEEIKQAIVEKLEEMVDELPEYMELLGDKIIDRLLEMKESAKEGWENFKQAADEKIAEMIDSIPELFRTMKDDGLAVIAEMATGGIVRFDDMEGGITSTTGSLVGTVISGFANMAQDVVDELISFEGMALGVFKDIDIGASESMQSLKNTISEIWTDIKNSFADGVNSLIGDINSLIDSFNSLGDTRVGSALIGGVFSDGIPNIPEMDGGTTSASPQAGGSSPGGAYHGLDRVPRNGGMYRLHRNEAVLPRNEAAAYRAGRSGGGSGGAGDGGVTVNINGGNYNVRQQSDIDAIGDSIAKQINSSIKGGALAHG
ncbi:phage tail tape measure protein [Salicibibacter cibarius]|uniref:Phage tail tape measure protein n=1 Tax=Salicibibacter cibarius TaxID=2743000 RepID=A0A7T7C9W6_9BACI|nr:phage tail tape measure protein [Salicibibacter cibarius]QQK74225.1 phage tail tape measure protein [Salicibibacter cibarius]